MNPALSLTQRKLHILLMVYEYGGVTLDHIRRRFWPNSRSHSPCSERISGLVKVGYLESRRLPALNGVGSGKAFLTLGPKGRPILAQVLGLSSSELGRIRLQSPQFIAHHLAICDFRLSVGMAVEMSDIFEVKEWVFDRELEIKVKDPKTEKGLLLIPDAGFTLALDGTEQPFYLEIDMGTVSAERLRAKIRGYLASEGSTPVMFVTVDRIRAADIARYAREEAQVLNGDPTIFWLTTKDRVTEGTVVDAPIWQVVGGPTIAFNSLAPSDYQCKPAFSPIGNITFNGGYLYDS